MPDAPDHPTNERVRVSALVLIPIVFFATMAIAFVLLVFNVGTSEEARGEVVSVTWSLACDHTQVTPVLDARAQSMGLSLAHSPSGAGTLVSQVTLPESEKDIQRLPQVLAWPGVLTIQNNLGETVVTNADLKSTGVEIDLAGMPTTMLRFEATGTHTLSKQLKEGNKPLDVQIDGETVATFIDLPDLDEGYLEIPSGEGVTRARMLVAVDRSIILGNGPLPCEVGVVGVVPADPAG